MKNIHQIALALTLLLIGCGKSDPEPGPEITVVSPTSKFFRLEENNDPGHMIIEDIKQYYQRTPVLPGDVTLNIHISNNPLLELDDNYNVIVKNSIDYESLSEDIKNHGIIFSITFEENSVETGQISGLMFHVDNVGPDGLVEVHENEGVYQINNLHSDLVSTTMQEYDDGSPVGEPIIEQNDRYKTAINSYENSHGQIAIGGAGNSFSNRYDDLSLVIYNERFNDRWGVINKNGLEIPAFIDGYTDSQDLRLVIAKHMHLFIKFLDRKGFPPEDAYDVITGEHPQEETIMKVYAALLAKRPVEIEDAWRAASNTIEILEDEDLLSPSSKVQQIIDTLNGE